MAHKYNQEIDEVNDQNGTETQNSQNLNGSGRFNIDVDFDQVDTKNPEFVDISLSHRK